MSKVEMAMPKELVKYVREEMGDQAPDTAEKWLVKARGCAGAGRQCEFNGQHRQAEKWYQLSAQMSAMATSMQVRKVSPL